MEAVDDSEDDDFPQNIAPRKKSRVLERSDGSDDDEDGSDGDIEIIEKPEESAEAELGA